MRLSVVVPCFNAERFVGDALASILSQSRPPDQIVIVDDGSTDGSVARIAGFGDRVRLVRQANRGAAAARNAGLAATDGALVAFLDADDLWPPGSLARRLAALDQADADIVFGAVRALLESPSGAARLGPPMQGRLAGSMVVRRRVFDRVGAFDETLASAEVVDFGARAQAAGFAHLSIGDVVLHRRVHGDNLMLHHGEASADALRVLRRSIERKRGRSFA
ncbi:MAG TPA: glycosyltransferase family A protein [Allosphingosinicella sp.]|nr:glycosyltransferase family A protein [Allosphingosinicella sp.]